MKRKTSTVPSRIWKFGLPFGPAKEDEARVDEQIRLSHKYKNKLLEIELRRREKYRAARRALLPNIEAAEADVAAAEKALEGERGDLRRARQAKRGRTPDVNLKAQKDALRKARAVLKAERAKASSSEDLKAAAAAIETEAKDEIKVARAACGVYWGTYLRIEKSHEQTRSEPTDPEFKRWDGSGYVGVHFMQGISVAQAFSGENTLLRISTPDSRGRAEVLLRIGSDNRAPVWARFALLLHRPTPSDARIKSAWAQRRKVGTRWRWELCMALESDTFKSPVRTPSHACGINLGWLKVDAGLHVGTLWGSDGHIQEIVVPNGILKRIEHARSIRSIRDRNFEAARDALCAALKTLPAPDWMKERTESLAQWRSTQRLSNLVWMSWRTQRFDGDREIFDVMDAWRKQDRHLLQWEASEIDRALGNRREVYRVVASQIAKRYSTIVIEKFNLNMLVRRKKAEEKETEAEQAQRSARFLAALSELRGAFKLACSNQGSNLREVDPAYITQDCHVCGFRCDFDAEHERRHVCESCGVEWDQDLNAARNLLNRGSDQTED